MGWRAIIVCGIGLGLWCEPMFAQAFSKPDALSVSALQKRIKSTQGDSELPSGIREKVLQFLQDAIERIEISQEHLERAERFERRLPLVADTLRSTERRLAESPTAADPAIAKVNDLNELDRMVESRMKQLDESDDGLRKRIANLEAEAEQWRIRPEELMNELAEVENRLREIDEEMGGLAASGEPRELMRAHQAFLQSRRQRAETERRALQAEAAWFQSPAAADLVQTQRDLAARELAVKLAELDLLQAELSKRRGDEADQRVHQAEIAVSQSGSDLKPLAQENLDIATERRDVANKLRELEHRHATTSTALLDLKKEFDRTQKMVIDVGLTDSIGLLLRQQRAKLLNPRGMRSDLSHRNDLVHETRMRLFQLDAECASLVDLDAATAKQASELRTANDRKSITAGLKSLLVERRQWFKGLDGDYTRYFQQLVEMDNVERHLLDLTTKYADYIDERVLWIRTGQTFGSDQLAKLSSPLAWISDQTSWLSAVDAVRHDAARHPFPWTIAAIALTIWLGVRPVLKRLVQRRGTLASEIHCREMSPTLQTISLTVVIASGWPIAVWFLGWRLDHSTSTVPFVHGVAAGLLRAATFALPLEVMRIVCVRGGLAEQHFDWPERSIVGWRRNLNWYLPVGLVLVGLIGMTEGTADEHRLDSLGRLTFLAFAALSAVFCQLTVRRARNPSTANNGELGTETESEIEVDTWSDRFWRFAPLLAVVASLGLLALGWSGFFYTALQLTWRLQSTAWLLVGLLMLRATVRRWIALERRRMAVLQDEELQTIADAGREPGNSGHNPFLFPRWTWPDFRLNLTQIVTQMRRLLDTGLIAMAVVGLWFVWADVTPALNILDRVTLWHTTVEQTISSDTPDKNASRSDGKSASAAAQTSPSENADRAPTFRTVRRAKRVTAANLGLAALIVAISVIAGRNIPGLVEVILLEHLSVDVGVRFAATCLVRYAIFATGVCCAFAQIGIGWSNVQWLVAAASVGLGFGLQEIFANFVSGIILLFERPMRVGDVITIGDTTGTISRIRFRATTIVDGDRKELIVPNKEFITGKLLNWTLSDRVNRLGVKVVVGSNNDPQRIRRLLLEIAAQQPNLLMDPAPTATLEEINGGLTFMLRAFLPTLDGRTGAMNDLYTAIHKRFEIEGVQMPGSSKDAIIRTATHDAHSASPPIPHQSPLGIPVKSLVTDFSTALRRS